MISKSAAAVFKQSQQAKYLSLVTAHQRNFAGGGPKKASMPATETNFDVVFVGMFSLKSYLNRRHECDCPPQVHPS